MADVEVGFGIFWNITGLRGSQDKDFWNFIKKFDFISLYEIWVKETDWETFKAF